MPRPVAALDANVSSAKLGWQEADKPARLRLVCDTYGLVAKDGAEELRFLDASITNGDAFVQRSGEPRDQRAF